MWITLATSLFTHFEYRETRCANPELRYIASYYNVTHKYLNLKINLSELLQILCETYAPP
ncbi:hypothetical protein B9T54_03175 [Leptospira borgpetersenii serovar Hardjo-bovis]|nr:hypothetical protein B9T54_03175 [Leptospira borgpetersenii serovar Hardjo-bovis]TQE53357.1 hypothetical protein FFZ95_07575 [Leptospira borgpetersenii]